MTNLSEDFSKTFYPFLHDGEIRGDGLDGLMEELKFALLEKARESAEVKTRFFEENRETILPLHWRWRGHFIADASCWFAATAGRRPTPSTSPSSSCTRSLSGAELFPRSA